MEQLFAEVGQNYSSVITLEMQIFKLRSNRQEIIYKARGDNVGDNVCNVRLEMDFTACIT